MSTHTHTPADKNRSAPNSRQCRCEEQGLVFKSEPYAPMIDVRADSSSVDVFARLQPQDTLQLPCDFGQLVPIAAEPLAAA